LKKSGGSRICHLPFRHLLASWHQKSETKSQTVLPVQKTFQNGVRRKCWESVLKIKIEIPESLKSELISEESVEKRDEYFGKPGKPTIPGIEYLLEQEIQNIPEDAEDDEQIEGPDEDRELNPVSE
jgi:hypothetical protein